MYIYDTFTTGDSSNAFFPYTGMYLQTLVFYIHRIASTRAHVYVRVRAHV